MGEVVDIDAQIQKEGLEATLVHLEDWLGTLQAQVDMIEMLIKGLRE